MSSRALTLATVTVVIGCLAAGAAYAQNLEAGKSPSQIFAGTCSACHKSPRGLVKSVGASSLPGFLRQHYTTSSDMASLLASYLISNGAADPRYQAKQGQDAARRETRPAGPADQLDRFGRRQHPASRIQEPDAQQGASPDAERLTPPGEIGHARRDIRRRQRSGEHPDETSPPEAATTDSKPAVRQRLGKRSRPGEELPKPKVEPQGASKPEALKPEPKADTANTDAGKHGSEPTEGVRPAAADKPDAARVDAPKEAGGSGPAPSRADPVPPAATAAPSSTPGSSADAPSAERSAPPAATAVAPSPPAAPAGSPPSQ